MKKLGLLIMLGLMFLISNSAFAAEQYELYDTTSEGQHYLDTSSIYKDKNNPNIIYYTTKTVWSPQYRDNSTNGYYSLFSNAINVQKKLAGFLEMKSYSSSGQLLSRMPFNPPQWEKFGANDQFYNKIIQITNGQAGQVSQPIVIQPATTGMGMVYNGPLRGQGWKMEKPKAGIDTDVKKIVISGLTTGG